MQKKSFGYRVYGRILRELSSFLSDRLYLKLLFKHRVGYSLNLDNPKSFNEKLQWLKLNDIHSEYTQMVDKIDAKKYVASIIGNEYIIPTLGVWNSVEEIDWDILPNQFVIKVTSDSGGIVVCKNKAELDIEQAKRKLKKGWGKNYYLYNKEYPYRDVKARIIAEKYMEDTVTKELRDYKFFCFNGEPRILKVDYNRFIEHRANYYDVNKNLLLFGEEICPPDYNKKIEFPSNLDDMVQIARKIAQSIPFVRVDLYNVDSQIYFGEITFFPASGTGKFTSLEWDYKLGDMIQLPIVR